jgi:Polyketide cyclase / dehydrase and lipid transport
MWEVRQSERSSAEPATVWALWADPARWSEWNDQVDRVEVDGPLEVGATARIKLRRGGKIHYTIIELKPERLLVDEAKLPGARIGHEHRISPTGDGVEISNRIYVRGPLASLYRLLMGRRVRQSVPRFVERERELAERASRASPSAPRRGSRRRRR